PVTIEVVERFYGELRSLQSYPSADELSLSRALEQYAFRKLS
ncbi:unnamed protein product, partial [marine sediment metagenome]